MGRKTMVATDGTAVSRTQHFVGGDSIHRDAIAVNGIMLCPYKQISHEEQVFLQNYLVSAIPYLRTALKITPCEMANATSSFQTERPPE